VRPPSELDAKRQPLDTAVFGRYLLSSARFIRSVNAWTLVFLPRQIPRKTCWSLLPVPVGDAKLDSVGLSPSRTSLSPATDFSGTSSP
jgi:hypothetical protein